MQNNKCQACGTDDNVSNIRRNTEYHDDSKNYGYFCGKCAEEDEAYWDSRWRELHSDIRQSIRDAENDRRRRFF